MSEKARGLTVNIILYCVALSAGFVPFVFTENLFLAEGLLTLTATGVIYIVTCFVPDTSLYDPYWSVAPPVMTGAAMIKYGYFSTDAILIFLCVCVWSLRLTANWVVTYRGLLHEDWRYAEFRKKCGPVLFAFINLAGFQLVPTIVVYAGLVGAFFVMMYGSFTPWMFAGLAVMLCGVFLEFASDTAIHRFLKEHEGEKKTCDISVWRYSRHPNYLGEMTFWTGIFLAFLSVKPGIWYYGFGFVLIIILFLSVSIPMMEKHNSERRPDYDDYKKRTPVLIPSFSGRGR